VSLSEVLKSMGRPRVLVIGDLIFDRYVWGETERISPEAPIPVLRVREEEWRPGGAGNVVRALAGLEAVVSCCGAVGEDEEGRLLSRMLEETCGGRCRLVRDVTRPTTAKTRFIGYVQSAHRATHHMLRVDKEDCEPISGEVAEELSAAVKEALPRQDAVLVSDYAKGLLTEGVLEEVLSACGKAGVPVVVDPKLAKDYRAYSGATLITPNRYETQVATGISIRSEEEMWAAAGKLQGELRVKSVVITLDRDGMFLYEAESGEPGARVRQAGLFGTKPREVYDVTGAGDLVASVLAMCVGAGVALSDAVQLANVGAGIEVGKVGAACVSRSEIATELGGMERGLPAKMKSLPELLRILQEHRRKNEKVVFTNGCFDLLHIGHIEYLKFARKQGDLLIVGLNSDRSVREFKGPGRPVLKEADRAEVLAALEDVDHIVVFDETTPERLIREIRPEVLVKGEDWREKGVVGREYVESYGGSVVLAPILEGIGTTEIIGRIVERYGNSQ